MRILCFEQHDVPIVATCTNSHPQHRKKHNELEQDLVTCVKYAQAWMVLANLKQK